MEAKFHKWVRTDLQEILARYYSVSLRLGDDFYAEFQVGIRKAVRNLRFFHFDRSGLRRCNLGLIPQGLNAGGRDRIGERHVGLARRPFP